MEDDLMQFPQHPLSPLPNTMNCIPTEDTDEDERWEDDKKKSPPPCASSVLHCDERMQPPPDFSSGVTTPCRSTEKEDQHFAFALLLQEIPQGKAIYYMGETLGQGKIIWWNGDVYQGSFVNDTREGHGTLTFGSPSGANNQTEDAGEYVGEWRQNQMHGSGTRRYPNGDVFMGDYENGKRQGQGRFYYANGDMYWGGWHNNQMHGEGRYYYASGQRFEGRFAYNKRTGKGKVQRTDGSLEIFQYVNDQRVGQGVRWSPSRAKAWRLWKPLTRRKWGPVLEQKRISIADAVTVVYEIGLAASNVEEDMISSGLL
jgi:hypothetical protein